ncbi:hypothetical protein SAMN05444389_1174 [Paracoccus solventivorans]|uniref:Uncharacterized protein n=1 Tax=Paracoccus solventivorans TaxID=53463 RepID=A0A1M7K5F4_9RHOB|nr:hypothetical protein SAMN05444389_1174 [Paracoccus solventivorans]
MPRLIHPAASPAKILPAALTERRRDVADRAKQNQGIVPGRFEAAPPPKLGSISVNGVDHQRPPADQRSGLNAALEGMLHKAGPDAQPCPSGVGRELAEQHARDRIRRLPRPDRARQNRRQHTGRRKAVVADHAPGLMNDENGSEALLLIGKGARLQPVGKSLLATGELGHIVSGGKRFGTRKEQGLTASPRSRAPTARDASGLRPSPERERQDAPAHP